MRERSNESDIKVVKERMSAGWNEEKRSEGGNETLNKRRKQ